MHWNGTSTEPPVASYTEAWIETVPSVIVMRTIGSPPTRRRGLKLGHDSAPLSEKVASYTEAWIETSLSRRSMMRRPSPPTRRRGLKQ